MIKLTRRARNSTGKTKNSLEAKLWPNGEISIWKPRTFKLKPLVKAQSRDEVEFKMARLRLSLTNSTLEGAIALLMGLSPLPIFDSLDVVPARTVESLTKPRNRKGLLGITSYGRRIVRNAAHLIENEGGKHRAVFATCTVPDLPIEQMRVLHERWHKVVEIYRLGLKRSLQREGLSGESVTVSEVQEKRYERTGVPVLHIHTVFVGKTSVGKWAVTPEDHDRIWVAALNSTGIVKLDKAPIACNLQRVKQSAEGYIGKYMTKGSKVVAELIRKGWASWIPKHWWSCSRSLRARVNAQTRRVSEFADWLNDCAGLEGAEVWLWHRDVTIQMKDGSSVVIAKYGRLKPSEVKRIKDFLDLSYDDT